MRPHTDPMPRTPLDAHERLGAEIGEARDRGDALEAARRGLLRGLVGAPHAFYVLEGDAFVMVASHRLTPVERFAEGGSLAAGVAALGGPVTTVGSHRARRLCARLDPADRDALRSMGTIALLPFFAGAQLVAFLCVGGGFDTFVAGQVARIAAPLVHRLERERVVRERERDPSHGTGARRP